MLTFVKIKKVYKKDFTFPFYLSSSIEIVLFPLLFSTTTFTKDKTPLSNLQSSDFQTENFLKTPCFNHFKHDESRRKLFSTAKQRRTY